MSFFHALYTGTAGMLSQERSTAVISENIANVSTTGYKRQDTAFHELVANNKNVTEPSRSVTSSRINRVTQQGGIQNTSSNTDLAIAGGGFFTVRATDDPTTEFFYTRNGTFQEDSEGILRNSAGYILYGWPITDGLVASGPTTASLESIDIDVLQTTSIPTTQASIRLNLDANETPINPHRIVPAQQLPVSNEPIHYSRSLEVYDTNGIGRDLTFEFRAITGPMAHFSSSSSNAGTGGIERDQLMIDLAGPSPNIVDGDILQIDDGTNTFNITFRAAAPDASLNEVSTFGELLDMINSFTTGGAQAFTATRDERGELTVQANDPTVTLDISGSSANILGAGGLNFIQDPDAVPDYTYEPDASLTANGTANPNQTAFPTFADTTTPNPYHWWEMRITTIDPAAPTGTGTVEISKGLINFNGDGSLNVTTDANGQALIDLGTINFDSTDGSEDTAIMLDIGSFTQFGGNYDVLFEEQNGTPIGQFNGVEVTRDGIVQSVFTNGQRVDSYQIPLANFTNPNGLERISGTAFAITAESGEPTINEAGTGGTGIFSVSALETSNVDIAEEFSSLIVNQRAFSLNSRVITTVDEMTENLAQLKR